MLRPDSILENRYKIVRPLGQGGMGAVYEAVDERFGTPVAVKEILLELGANAEESKRKLVRDAFEREAKALANARHEAVPFVRDYFSEGDSEFLVMELVEGDELAELLASHRAPFMVEEALGWLDQLLDALDYLHTLTPPIVHRDIKPQNLKLNARGRVKLLDFGIAKSIDAGSATVTSHTFLAATLNYSPIEQILRVIDPTFREFVLLSHREMAETVLSQTTDARCDIYALGATFYHLLTNRVPVDATKRAVEVWSGKDDPLESPSALNPLIPEALSAFLLTSMAIRRDDRFVSAREMRQAMPTSGDLTSDSLSHDAKTVAYPAANSGELKELDQKEKMRAETEVLPPAHDAGSVDETVAGPTITDEAVSPTRKADTDSGQSVETLPAADTRGSQETRSTGDSERLNTGGSSGVLSKDWKEALAAVDSGSSGFRKWIIPAAGGAGIMLGAVFLGVVWLAMPDPEPPDPFTDVNAATPSPTETATPEAELVPATPVVEATPEQTPAGPTITPSVRTPEPNRGGPPKVSTAKSPTVTPAPRPRTPTPTPKKMTDDCLYNGRCR